MHDHAVLRQLLHARQWSSFLYFWRQFLKSAFLLWFRGQNIVHVQRLWLHIAISNERSCIICLMFTSFLRIFEPCWKFLQSSTEKLANVHSQVIQHLNDVSKAVREYGEQQKEKQKQVWCDFYPKILYSIETSLSVSCFSIRCVRSR